MTHKLFDLTGKRALVTGSSQGIGFAIAKGLAEHGAAVVLNGRDRARLETAAADIIEHRQLCGELDGIVKRRDHRASYQPDAAGAGRDR